MSSRRKTRDEVGVTLFPFMAVLICTTGALIMLLVVMVQQARVSAAQPVANTSVAPPVVDNSAALAQLRQNAEVEAENQRRLALHEEQMALAERNRQEIEDYKWQTSMLLESYEKTVEDLADQRLALSHLESHTRELSDKASEMQAEADLIAATNNEKLTKKDGQQEQLAVLSSKIENAKTEIEEAKRAVTNRPTKYALVPYEGPNSTTRPPIYIECQGDRVVLQPENIVLTEEDFEPPLSIENPLAVALRAKREFMLKQGLLPENAEPYPLLVIRPRAAASQAAARVAMKAWESEFGYELVEAEVELDYQKADPRLVTLLSDVIEESRERRRLMRSAITRPVERELLRPSADGGFEVVGRNSPLRARIGRTGLSDAGAFGSRGGVRQSPAGPVGNRFDSGGFPPGGVDARGTGQFGAGAIGNGADSVSSPTRSGSPLRPGAGARPGTGTSPGTGSGANPGAGQGGVVEPNGDNLASSSTYETDGISPPFSKHRNRLRDGSFSTGPASASVSTDIPDPSAPTGLGADKTGPAGLGGNSAEATGSGGQGSTGTGGQSSASSAPAANSSTMSSFGSTQSLANRRGVNWALPDARPNAVGIKRPIRVICKRDSLVLIPEKGTKESMRIFRHEGSLAAVIDPFVDAVQSRLDNWGIAGQGIYWRPVLQLDLGAGARDHYRQMAQLLENSGIEVTREP